jgi:hypothetical protein
MRPLSGVGGAQSPVTNVTSILFHDPHPASLSPKIAKLRPEQGTTSYVLTSAWYIDVAFRCKMVMLVVFTALN